MINFASMFLPFDAIFIVVSIFIFLCFTVTIVSIVSPKFRAKMMKRQIKATKYMFEEAQEDLEDISAIQAQTVINSKKKILDKNEKVLKDMTVRDANIEAEAIEIKAGALRKGLSKNTVHCKYCGKKVDDDSVFCKYCGKNLE